ncbi:MAG: hypothetical protein IBV52_04610 [Candidatus Bathyarchaeota archaeon]
MNTKALVAAFVLALSISVVAGTQLVSVVKANPFWWYEGVPPDEYTEAPVISVLSPANNTVFNEDNVYLSFNVDVGESETALDTVLLLVSYEADWQHDNIAQFAPWSGPYPFVHEVNLTGIPEGNHSITFQAIERGTYTGAHAFNIDSSETILFTIDTNPETDIPEFPSWTILPIFLVATFLALAVRKRLLHPISQLQ